MGQEVEKAKEFIFFLFKAAFVLKIFKCCQISKLVSPPLQHWSYLLYNFNLDAPDFLN